MEGAAGPVVIVGGGFSGLAVAHELAGRGIRCTVLEADATLGGLAGTFAVPGGEIEKFYHHWFTSDTAVFEIVHELGLDNRLVRRPSRTGLYFANHIYRLATPMDVLKFRALSLFDRVRLGLSVLRARRVRDWRSLESVTAAEWLTGLCGKRAYRVVWEPLLRGKFGRHAEQISAVWMWNKLMLRGGSRGRGGREELVYFDGGFGELVRHWVEQLGQVGVEIRTGCPVRKLAVEAGRVRGAHVDGGFMPAGHVIVTTAIPQFLDMCPELPAEERARLARIEYLGNVCLVLCLRRSLSDIYWLNVNDPSFPFVGIIEHTNFQPPSAYAGTHWAYLSRYVEADDPFFRVGDDELLNLCIPHIRRMFPAFDPDWIQRHFVWRARYAQPVVVREYSKLIPAFQTMIGGLWLCTMAQVYPEDRGTNYAVAYGRRVGRMVADAMAGSATKPAVHDMPR